MKGHDSIRDGFLYDLERLCKKWDQHDMKVEWDVTEDFSILVTVPSPDGTSTTFMVPYHRPFDKAAEPDPDDGREWM